MITRISIKSVASYDATGVDIDTNKKINYFFGYNGSGKSTIARYLHNITLPSFEQSPDFSYCSQVGFNPATETVLVYNEEFKRDNFITKDEQRGIFSLNKINSEIDGLIKQSNSLVSDYQKNLLGSKSREATLRANQERKLRELEEYVFSKRTQFSSCRNASIPYSGSKKSFQTHIRSFLKHSELVKSLPELLQEYNRIYGNGIHNIPYDVNLSAFDTLIEQEAPISALLAEVIIGNKDVDIAALIDSLKMSSWVEQGLPYLEQSGEICPFCQQPFENKTDLQHKFEQFFDKTYKEKIESIRVKANTYVAGIESFLGVLSEVVKVYNPDNKVSSLIGDLQSFKGVFSQVITDKFNKPNEIKTILSLSVFRGRIVEIKGLISTNNSDFSNISTLQEQWLKDVQIYIAGDCRKTIEKYDKWKEKSDQVLNQNSFIQSTLQEHITYQLGKIDEYRKHTVNTVDAVNNIKRLLTNVGFDSFEIEEKTIPGSTSPTYYLKRNGSTAANVYQSLSEGEKTFISFLYFHQLCLGTDDLDHSSKKKIVVIDDPVSSLDSKTLFVITTLIHQLARYKYVEGAPNADKQVFLNSNIEQIFILSHNFYFYKEVSFSRRPINTNRNHFIIEKNHSVTQISCKGENMTLKNDYSMMWDNLKAAKASLGNDKSQNVMLANTMRRIIDTYLDFVGMQKSGTSITWSALDSYTEGSPEYIVGSAFISIINDESHGISALDDMYYDSIVKQEPSIIFAAFKSLFKDIGASHYEYMMGETY
ncbi:MAG: AAA family ATPase [Prevotella sp.]|nr:AAA family ATPase [Prevotella sp.]